MCTTGPNLGRNLGTSCVCGVDNENCPQPSPIHPRVIPDSSPGGHALRTGKTGEIHSFHRTYYYPCSSSRKFLLKAGCVDKSRGTAGPIRGRTETRRRATGTSSKPRADAGTTPPRRVVRGSSFRRSSTDGALAHSCPVRIPLHSGRPDTAVLGCPQRYEGTTVDRGPAVPSSPSTAVPTPRRTLPRWWDHEDGQLWPDCRCRGRKDYPAHGGAAEAVARNAVRSNVGRLCQTSVAGRSSGSHSDRRAPGRRSRRGGIHGGSTAADPH